MLPPLITTPGLWRGAMCTIQYGISNCPELDMEGHWERTVEHLLEKCPIGNHHIIFCGDYNELFKAFVSVVL